MSTRTEQKRHVADVTLARSYEQWCPIAVGLDLLGDRWTLLILRELMLDDQRFTDLRQALRGLAPNLLSDRLRALTEMGLVVTAELPPPAARTVYRITDDGRDAAPVLRALARFGVRHLAGEPGTDMDARRAANALMVPWYRPGRRELRARLVLTPSGRGEPTAVDMLLTRPIVLVRSEPEAGEPVDITLTTSAEALAAARRDGVPLDVVPAGSARDVALFREAFSI